MKLFCFAHQRKIKQYLKEKKVRERERERAQVKITKQNSLLTWEHGETGTLTAISLHLGRKNLHETGLSYQVILKGHSTLSTSQTCICEA